MHIWSALKFSLYYTIFITFVKNPIHYNGKDETAHQFVGEKI